MFIPFSYDVVLCTYNGAEYIVKQLDSIINQKITPTQIIISDDGSTDETLSLINNYLKNKNLKNYKIFNNPQKGIVENFMFAISKSKSDFIFLSDQDDIWEINKIESFYNEFIKQESSKPVLIFSDASLIDKDGNTIANSFFSYQNLTYDIFKDDSILYKNCVQGAACAFNKELKNILLDSLKVISLSNIYMHDWWIGLIAKYYGQAIFINKPLLKYRQHQNNQIGAKKNNLFHYFINFNSFFKNFKKAIIQKNEFTKFHFTYTNKKLKNLSFKHIPCLKRIIINLLRL